MVLLYIVFTILVTLTSKCQDFIDFDKIKLRLLMSGLYQKQVTIILVITGICVTICVLLYCLSITNDWTDLQAFYFSFAERRLLLREGRMVHKRGQFGHQVIASLVSCSECSRDHVTRAARRCRAQYSCYVIMFRLLQGCSAV